MKTIIESIKVWVKSKWENPYIKACLIMGAVIVVLVFVIFLIVRYV
jgi:hypothetical protein